MLGRVYLLTILHSVDSYPKWLEEKGIADQVVSCIEDIAKNFFAWSGHFLLISGGGFLANEALKGWEPNFGLIVADKECRINFRGVSNCVVLDDDFHVAFRDMTVNRRGRYVVVTTKREKFIEDAGATLWDRGFADVIFLKPQTNETVTVYGYDVLSKYLNTTGLYVIDRWNNGFLNGGILFPPKMTDMKGYPLRVSAWGSEQAEPDVYKILNNGKTQFHGLGANVINLFSEKLNFSLVILDEDADGLGYQHADGSWNGIIGQIGRGIVDIGFALLLPTPTKLDSMDLSASYRWEKIHFVMKPRDRAVSWMSAFMSLSVQVWTCVLLVSVGYLFLMRVVRRMHEMNMVREYIRIIDVCGATFNQNVSHPTNGGLRIAFALWLLFAYLITSTYTSSLVSVLTRPNYRSNLNTFKELKDSGMPFGGSITVKSFLNDTDDPLVYDLHNRYINVSLGEIRSSIFTRNMVTISTEGSALLYNYKHKADPSQQIHLLRDQIVSYPATFYLAKGHPYLVPLNNLIGLIHSSGFMKKWTQDYNVKQTKNTKKQEATVLTLIQLGGVFLILLSGLSVSIVVFLIEFYRGKPSPPSPQRYVLQLK